MRKKKSLKDKDRRKLKGESLNDKLSNRDSKKKERGKLNAEKE